jgi:hypothetical protein
MATEAVIRRRASVFSSPGEPSRGGTPTGSAMMRFGALFSDIYDKENNCTSGIAMFMQFAGFGRRARYLPLLRLLGT